MSVAMTNAGRAGWVSDRSGYRYSPLDPLSGKAWPPLPELLSRLASNAAASAGFSAFEPDVCLINRYEPGARMALHQDKDERDFAQPIVSLSLGLPATFMFGGLKRTDKPVRIRLLSGDVIVWGGVNRLAYHGIAPLAKGVHPLTGAFRINLTFRRGL
jgi:alkylated DNA repair protein (DNA oxidative demethylase)